MKNYLNLVIFIGGTLQCSSQELITVIENNNHYYYFRHEVLTHKLPEDWKTKVYINSFCLNKDQTLISQFNYTQNALINHFANFIDPNKVELFNSIRVRIYLKTDDLQIEHAVLMVSQEVVTNIHEEIIHKLLNEALKINFKSLSDVDLSSCKNINDYQWVLWKTPLVTNGKLMQISP